MATQSIPNTNITEPPTTPESEEMVRFTLELPLSLHQALSLKAVIDRTSKASIIRHLLQESLQSKES